MSATRQTSESGQAAIESALTLPLSIFMVLGLLQLFMMLQGRIMAQYAVYKAVRAGSLNYGDCDRMKQAAVAALLPSIFSFYDTLKPANTPTAFAAAFARRYSRGAPNHYFPAEDDGHGGQIVEIVREQPVGVPGPEDYEYDSPKNNGSNPPIWRLEIRMVYWYRLKIPFANWVMEKMFLAYLGIQSYVGPSNPLMLTQTASWTRQGTLTDEGWPGGGLASNMTAWSGAGHYLFPIKVNAAMRMMTPPKAQYFTGGCSAP